MLWRVVAFLLSAQSGILDMMTTLDRTGEAKWLKEMEHSARAGYQVVCSWSPRDCVWVHHIPFLPPLKLGFLSTPPLEGKQTSLEQVGASFKGNTSYNIHPCGSTDGANRRASYRFSFFITVCGRVKGYHCYELICLRCVDIYLHFRVSIPRLVIIEHLEYKTVLNT